MAKAKRKLGDVTEAEIVEAGAAAEKVCDEYKTKQYKPICKIVVSKFTDELVKRGGTPAAVRDAANAVEADCKRYKTGQYQSVCERSVAKMIREIRRVKPGGLAGRKRRR